MSQLARMLLSINGAVTTGFLAVMWVWSYPYLDNVVQQYPGPFSSTWETIAIVVPVTIGLYYIIFIGYVLWGPVEQERARRTTRR